MDITKTDRRGGLVKYIWLVTGKFSVVAFRDTLFVSAARKSGGSASIFHWLYAPAVHPDR